MVEIKARSVANEEFYNKLNGKDVRRIAIRLAKQKNWEVLDIYEITLVQDSNDRQILIEDQGIRAR